MLKKIFNTTVVLNQTVLVISGAALLSSAFFLEGVQQTVVIVSVMLFTPLLDRQWRVKDAHRQSYTFYWFVTAILLLALLFLRPLSLDVLTNQLLFVAIPEEWYFRVYLMNRLGMRHRSILVSSCYFSILHAITRGWMIGLLVFIPSLLLGKVYQTRRDAVFVISLHFLANIVYVLFIEQFIIGWVI